jgi:hypothetical protein
MKCRFGLTYLYDLLTYLKTLKSEVLRVSLLTTTTCSSLHVPQAIQYLMFWTQPATLPALLKSRDPFCTIPPSRNRHTNIDIKFKTHFASTSYRVQNSHTHRQYSLFNYISISLKNTKNLSFVFRPHPTQHDNILQCCNNLPSSLTPHW